MDDFLMILQPCCRRLKSVYEWTGTRHTAYVSAVAISQTYISVRCTTCQWLLCGLLLALSAFTSFADETDKMTDVELRDRIKQAMSQGCDYFRRNQNGDGSWHTPDGSYHNFPVGLTSLAVLAQINCDVPVDSPHIQKGLSFLRKVPAEQPARVYDMSLMVMALAAAEEHDRDMARIRHLANLLEESQEKTGENSGLWTYAIRNRGNDPYHPDRSNGQYAILALREAAYYGVEVSQETWKRTHTHWVNGQAADGGWSYETGTGPSTGSMTTAGLSTVAITTRMVQDDSDVDAQGKPDCCGSVNPGNTMDRGRQWMAKFFSVYSNPGKGAWQYYYLYGMERAGRLSNARFFGEHDWYREGARYFLESQRAAGNWVSPDGSEKDTTMSTAMALLFLSKGLSRVVVNKLDYSSPAGESLEAGEWNRHPLDVINLVDLIDTLPYWPPRLTSQTLTLSRLKPETAVSDMNQAPVLFLSGREAPVLTDEHVRWLREYIDEGGFIFASANCDGKGFDAEFRRLVSRLFPRGEASLRRLTAEHPVFRAEYRLPPDGVELWGVDFGCRTAIIYSPDDIGCLWQKWQRHNGAHRNQNLTQRISRGISIGVNVLAYATGREPPEKLNDDGDQSGDPSAKIERGLLQIAKLRYAGSWDTAPRALGNLLKALNTTVGMAASTRNEAVPVTLEAMSRFPLVYMHGKDRFHLPQPQSDALRDYLNRGGFLFADACCGSASFDQSFRDLADQLFPEHPLVQIPAGHEVFSKNMGDDIRTATRRRLVPDDGNASLKSVEETGPPILEGIEIDGRLAVIYSKYDISCALEHQASLACDGYVEKDAARIAINVVIYSMLQNIVWSPRLDTADAVTRPR